MLFLLDPVAEQRAHTHTPPLKNKHQATNVSSNRIYVPLSVYVTLIALHKIKNLIFRTTAKEHKSSERN